ncbi:MAG: hypothetical protein ACRCTZ_03800 [Sarcina sp.]
MKVVYRLNGDSAKEFGEDNVVCAYEHMASIDDIENRVSNALKHIEEIEGIDLIDRCKDELRSLLDDLY